MWQKCGNVHVVGMRRSVQSHWRSTMRVVAKASSSRQGKTRSADDEKKKVIVIGGGWAGFAAAKHLSQQEDIAVQLLDANPNPGGLSTAFMTKDGREIEAGVKGFWYDYPNINALCRDMEIDPFTDYLTSGFWKRREHSSSAELVTEAPVFSKKMQLPTILGQFVYTAPLFYRLSLADRASIIPWLYDTINFTRDEGTYKQYDSMSAREMFKRAGVSDNAYQYFLKPTLEVGLFAPPEELSAAVTLELLIFYALNNQESFDVKWCKGSISEKIFQPLVERIKACGGSIVGSTFVTGVNVDEQQGTIKVSTVETSFGEKKLKKTKIYEADALVFALSISGMQKIIASDQSHALAGREEFQRMMKLRSIDCIATRLWFDQELPTRFPANVLADFEACGCTYFNTTDMQGVSDPGTVISADFYGASTLLPLTDDEIIQKVYKNLIACDPVFRDATIVDSAVLRFPNAVTHFSPGSYINRPKQVTSFDNVFIAGDYVKDVPHGANGLSQERAWVTGLLAANMVIEHLGVGEQADILPTMEEEPHISLAKEVNKAIITALPAFSLRSTF